MGGGIDAGVASQERLRPRYGEYQGSLAAMSVWPGTMSALAGLEKTCAVVW